MREFTLNFIDARKYTSKSDHQGSGFTPKLSLDYSRYLQSLLAPMNLQAAK